MNKKKTIILASIIIGILIVTLGLTYAVLSFNQTGGNSQLVLGDIYMHYGETNQINLQNAIPTESYLPNGYFEFTIDGKNTYTKKDIWYEIVLNHGDNHETRTTRIRDDLLKFRLVEVNNNVETELFTNKSYSSLTNKRIWVDTISKNTTSEITKTYRLYMWISNDTKVGNTQDADYDNETWNEDVYGSIKVNVIGDFEEKSIAQPASCFTYEEAPDLGNYYVYYYDDEYRTYELNTSDEALGKCMNYMSTMVYSGENSDQNDDFKAFCQGIGTVYLESMHYQLFMKYNFTNTHVDYLVENNVLIPVENPKTGMMILDYDISCGLDVIIPNKLDGKDVLAISDTGYTEYNTRKWYKGFSRKGITSVSLPETLTYIGNSAFYNNVLTSVEIPNNVTRIEITDFNGNKLIDVKLSNNLLYIGPDSFEGNQIKSIVIPEGVITVSGYAFATNFLEDIVIPDSVIIIGEGVFIENKLPDSKAFIYARKDDNNDGIAEIDTSTIIGYGGINKNVIIPDGVTTIGSHAFYSSELTSVTIPNSVTSIGNDAFRNNNLTTVDIPSSVTSLSCDAFDVDVTINKSDSLVCYN